MGKVAGGTGSRTAALGVLFITLLAAMAAQARAATIQASIQEFYTGLPVTSYADHIAVGPDGNLWFTAHNAARIDRLTPEGILTEFFVAPNSNPQGITAGPDGNLWFTEPGHQRIGRITPAGAITEFASDGITGQPEGITAGPDGNVWFTESSGTIGRITPAGLVTEFSAGITAGGLYGITAGPEGNLWFTEESKIGRITPAGVVTEFSQGITPGSEPHDITLGPDGNLWFTERAGNRIGRITPAGLVTEFSAGITPGSEPQEIVPGPRGNLWFTERAGNRIGRITYGGLVTEFSAGVTAGSEPAGIVAGPEGSLWFTEEIGQIGQLRVGASRPPTVVTEPSSAVTQNSATLNATVNPNGGAVSDCHFEYGTSEAYGFSVPCASLPGSGESPVKVSASLGSLSANTIYHVRVVATNPGGTSYGPDQTDQTLTETPACTDCFTSVGKAPLGPQEPAGGWSVEYADTFTKPLGTASGQDNTWFPNNCESLSGNCEGFNGNEIEDFNASKVSTGNEGLKLTCSYTSEAQEPGGKHYLCGVVKGRGEEHPGYKNFTWSAGHGATLVFQAVARFPVNTNEADPGWWANGPPWNETEFDFFEAGGWGSQHTTEWKTDELYTAWFAAPHINATKYGFAKNPAAAYNTYTTEIFPNNTYSEWVNGELQSWGTAIGPAEPITSVKSHLILSYALRTCGECSTGFTSGSRSFDVKSVAVYEDKAHAGVGLENTGLAPGTGVE